MKHKYTKEEFGELKQDILVLEHQIRTKVDNIKTDINTVIDKLSKYDTKFVKTIIMELEIPIQGSDYEALNDYDRDFYYSLPNVIQYDDVTITIYYCDYDLFNGDFTIIIGDETLISFSELINYLGQHNGK